MKTVKRLTESDLTKIVNKIILKENNEVEEKEVKTGPINHPAYGKIDDVIDQLDELEKKAKREVINSVTGVDGYDREIDGIIATGFSKLRDTFSKKIKEKIRDIVIQKTEAEKTQKQRKMMEMEKMKQERLRSEREQAKNSGRNYTY